MTAIAVQRAIKKRARPEKKALYQRFFKTGPGQYGEGDIFLGCTMPDNRAVAKEFVDLSFPEIKKLLDSKIHEDRMIGLLILTYRYSEAGRIKKLKNVENKKRAEAEQKDIFYFYLKNLKAANNWDLVDVTVPRIIGDYFLTRSNKIIYSWARSHDLWERRVAILTTYNKIKQGDFKDIFKLAEMLMQDREDLIHKALGWMLREAWKVKSAPVEEFLKKHVRTLSRTTFRYAIEGMEEKKRKEWLKK